MATTRKKNTAVAVDGFSVEDFYVFQDAETVADGLLATREITAAVCGEPMHAPEEELLNRLKTETLEDFLATEARYSIGNYALVQREGNLCRIITSPGYCGGYVYAREGTVSVGTLLVDVLAGVPGEVQMHPFGVSFYLNYAPGSNFNQLPLSTMFWYVKRLAPGSILEFENGQLVRHRSYLMMEGRRAAPGTFNQAMEEMSAALARYFKRKSKTKAALMFSGGVDSLILYLMLREILDPADIRVFTMGYSSTNGPERALPIAKVLGMNLELVPALIQQSAKGEAALKKMMKQDLITFQAPHLSLIDMDLSDTVVFHGQNFDALANIHMEVLQETQELGYYSAPARRLAHTENRVLRQTKAFMGNMQLTDAYLEDERMQMLTAQYYSEIRSNTTPDPEPGRDGVLRGMVSSQYPNLLSPAKYPFPQVRELDKEIKLLRSYCPEIDESPRNAVDMARYLTYTQIAAKRATTFPMGKGTRLFFAAMSGPITSYFLGKPRGMSYASQPKQEIYAYAKAKAGMPYRDLIKGDGKKISKHEAAGKRSNEAMLKRSLNMIKPENSKVLKSIPSPKATTFITGIYSELSEAYQKGGTSGAQPSVYQVQLGLRVMNLEALLQEVDRRKRARAK